LAGACAKVAQILTERRQAKNVKCVCCGHNHRNEREVQKCCASFEKQASAFKREGYIQDLPADVEQKRKRITFFWEKHNPD